MSRAQQAEARRQCIYAMLLKAASEGALTPTHREMGEAIGAAPTSCGKIIEALEMRDLIRRLPGFSIFVVEIGRATRPMTASRLDGQERRRAQDSAMLHVLERYVGQSLPSNRVLANMAGFGNETAGKEAVNRLRISGLVEIETDFLGQGRFLRAINQTPVVGNDSLIRVDNTICPCCGVRAAAHEQFGCSRKLAA